MTKTKLLTIFVICSVFLYSLPVLGAADGFGLQTAAKKAQYETSGNDVYSIVATTFQVFFAIVGFIFFGYMLYSGIRWMTARGNEEFITKAKNNMLSAVYGLVIIFIAYALTTFIFTLLNKK